MQSLSQTLKLKTLLFKLSGSDWASVAQAAEALGELGDPRAVPELVRVLTFGERFPARQAAARALGRIGAPVAVAALVTRLDDEEDYVRFEVLKSLAVLRAPESIPRIAAMLRHDSGSVRSAAVEALAVFGERPVEWLVPMLMREAFFTRQAAARALGLIGGARAVEALLAALRDEDYTVRCEVVESLARLGQIAEAPLREFVRDARVNVRLAAIKTLTRIKNQTAISVLGEATHDDVPEVREAAWHALSILGSAAAHEREMVQRAIKFGDFQRAAAAGAAAVEPLLEAFRGGNLELREKVRAAIEKIGPAAHGELLTALKDLDIDVRQFAARLLDALGWKPVDALERISVAIATGRFAETVSEGAAAFEPLCAALLDREEWNRVLAARALGELDDARAVEPLSRALGDDAFKVREAVVNALGRLGGDAAMAALRAAAQDKHYNVASAARAALKQLPGSAA